MQRPGNRAAARTGGTKKKGGNRKIPALLSFRRGPTAARTDQRTLAFGATACSAAGCASASCAGAI